jgi:hypothetical protein
MESVGRNGRILCFRRQLDVSLGECTEALMRSNLTIMHMSTD